VNGSLVADPPDSLQLLQLLDLAVSPAEVAVAEKGLDSLLDSRDFLLLALVELALLLDTLGLLPSEIGVGPGVGAGGSGVQLDYLADDLVKEIAIVAHYKRRALVAGQEELLQPLYGVDVEVVGGLVEQQQVRG